MQSVRKKTVSFLLTLIVLLGVVAGTGLQVAAGDSIYLTKQPKSGTCDKSLEYTITWAFNQQPRQVVMQNYNYKRGTWGNGSDVTDQTSYSFVYIKGDYLSSDGANKHRLLFTDKTNNTYYSDDIIITWTGMEPESFWIQPKSGTCDKSNPYQFTWKLGKTPYHVVVEVYYDGSWRVDRGVDGKTSYSVYYQERSTDRYRLRAEYSSGYIYSDEISITWTGKEPRAFWLQPTSGTCSTSSTYPIEWAFGGFAPDNVKLQVYLPDFDTWADLKDVTTVASYSIPYSNHESDIYRLVAKWTSVNKQIYSNFFKITWKNIGWVTEGDKTYYYDDNGNKVTGWQKLSYMVSGRTQLVWFYFDPNGVMLTGKQVIDGKTYLFYATGFLATGWTTVGNTRYYCTKDDGLVTGWKEIKNEWYYFESTGAMQTGWVQVSGTWYYLDSEGKMLKEWQKIDGSWYYLGGNGAMRKDWQKINGVWYYLGGNGVMRTGWQQIGGVWYYFKSSGAMASSEYCGGYWLNADGSWTYKHKASWRKTNNKWWYGDDAGWYAKNQSLRIDGVLQYFDANGYWIDER